MGDADIVAGPVRPAPPRISDAAPTLAGWPTDVEYRNVHGGEYRMVGERSPAGGTIMLWHNGRRVGRVAENFEGSWRLHPFQSCRGWLAGDTAAEVLADVVRKWDLHPATVTA